MAKGASKLQPDLPSCRVTIKQRLLASLCLGWTLQLGPLVRMHARLVRCTRTQLQACGLDQQGSERAVHRTDRA